MVAANSPAISRKDVGRAALAGNRETRLASPRAMPSTIISRNRARTNGSRMRRKAQNAAPIRMTVEMITQIFTVVC